MSAPVIPALSSSTNNRKWMYLINTGTFAAKNFVVLGGLRQSTFNPDNPNWNDSTRQEGRGFKSQNKSGADWSGQVTVDRAPLLSNPTQYDIAQEYVRTHAIGVFGTANQIEILVFEYDPNDPNGVSTPRIEAYQGLCGCSWQPSGGDMMADDEVQIAFISQGALNQVSHPYPATPVVPVVTAVTPLAGGIAGGTMVVIKGRGFNGAVGVGAGGVKFGTSNATSFTVLDDSTIVAVAPAHSAGNAAVIVTNGVGASTTGPNFVYS